MEKSEAYLRRIRRQYNQLRKVHKLKDEDELEVIAGLRVTYQLIARRVQQEALIFAQEAPVETLSFSERQEHRARAKDISELFSMANKTRDLARQMMQDSADEIQATNSPPTVAEANVSIIEDARKAIEEMNFSFQLDDGILESIECEKTTES